MWDQNSVPGLGQYLLANSLGGNYGAPNLGGMMNADAAANGQSPFVGGPAPFGAPGPTPNYPQSFPMGGTGGGPPAPTPTLTDQANAQAAAAGPPNRAAGPTAPTLPSQASPQAQAALSRAPAFNR